MTSPTVALTRSDELMGPTIGDGENAVLGIDTLAVTVLMPTANAVVPTCGEVGTGIEPIPLTKTAMSNAMAVDAAIENDSLMGPHAMS